jgi:hypothetical protein
MKHPLLLLLLVSGLTQAAGIQKWIDEDGVVHYGDTPPLRVQAEPVSVTRPPSNPGKPLPRLNPDDGKPAATASAGATPVEQKKFNPDKDAKRICERARNDLQVIQRSTRVKLRQADGSERYMTAEEIAQRREKSQKLIDKYCK